MTIEERFENMEKQMRCIKQRNRWQLGAILLVAWGLVVLPVLAIKAFPERGQMAETAKEIRANSFTLVDENGMARGRIGIAQGHVMFALFDEKKTPRIIIDVGKDAEGVLLVDENSISRVTLSLSKNGGDLALRDENGKVIWSPIKKSMPQLALQFARLDIQASFR